MLAVVAVAAVAVAPPAMEAERPAAGVVTTLATTTAPGSVGVLPHRLLRLLALSGHPLHVVVPLPAAGR